MSQKQDKKQQQQPKPCDGNCGGKCGNKDCPCSVGKADPNKAKGGDCGCKTKKK